MMGVFDSLAIITSISHTTEGRRFTIAQMALHLRIIFFTIAQFSTLRLRKTL